MKINRELLRGSFVMLFAFGIFNVLNFIFQASMARLLTLAEFGVLSVLYNMIYVMGGVSESMQLMMAKFAANEKEDGKVRNIAKRAMKKMGLVSCVVFLVYLLVSYPVSLFTKIDYFLVSFTGLLIFFIFLTPINRGILQGRKRFGALGGNMILESVSKLILSILLVLLGWSVFGAILGTIVGSGLAFLISFSSLKGIIVSKEGVGNSDEIYKIRNSSFVVVLSVLIIYSFDVVLAKIFFDSETAGAYAIVSLMAKTIFFGTQPITKTMFPISAEVGHGKNESRNVFLNSFLMILIFSAIALILFYQFPHFIIRLFSGRELGEIGEILFVLGIGTSLLSLSNLLLLYKLSTSGIKRPGVILFSVVVEVLILFVLNSLLGFSVQSFAYVFVSLIAVFFVVVVLSSSKKIVKINH